MRHLRRPSGLVVVVAALLGACASAPPRGTAEHAAWIKERQEIAAAIEYSGRHGDSLRWFPLPALR